MGVIIMRKSTLAVLCSVVLALLIAEGLIIGLVGRPSCDVYSPPETVITTTKSPQTTTTKPNVAKTTTTTAVATTADPGPWNSYRIPLNLIPYEYDVSLRPILEPDENGVYLLKGTSTVRYTCQDPTTYIILHSRGLIYTLSDWTLMEVGGAAIQIKDMKFQVSLEQVILETELPCEQGVKYELTVKDYDGQLDNRIKGMFYANYMTSNGENKIIAATQMEWTDARQTFPCFDEPYFKSTFKIQLWNKIGCECFSLSNMPVESYTTEDFDSESWNGTIFEKSVVMPTYLLAMVISDFKFEESFTSDGIQTNIYARPEYIDSGYGIYAADVTPKILEYFIEYIGVGYPLQKSDQISVPTFGGAMENWGLVIYGEDYLMYDEATTSDDWKIIVTSIIAHELAHQWFGNLVSCEWWDQLWLNEGFATYYASIGEEGVQPTWKTQERFILGEMRLAFAVDETNTSRPIVRPEVNSENEIQNMFDTITYSKGGSVLRMVNGFMGKENFVNGTRDYLEALQYGVAHQDQLFSFWEKYATSLSLPTELSIIMETWTLQMGFPIISVQDQDPLTNTFRVTQDYYLRDPGAIPSQTPGSLKYGYKWYVPFTFKRGSNLKKEAELVWITPDSAVTLTESDFILGNAGVEGYYRVNYDRDSWDRISNRLNSEFYQDIPEENRAQLLDDAFSFSTSGRLNPVVPLELARYLSLDESYISWNSFIDGMKYFEYMLGRTEVFGTFKNYMLQLVVPSLYEKYGWEDGIFTDDKLMERMTRATGIEAACYNEHPDCINTSFTYFNNWKATPNDWTIIPRNSRRSILCTVIRQGGIEEWNFAFERYSAVEIGDFRSSLRYGMSCSKDPWILNRYLEYTLDESKIRPQDAISTMQYVGGEDYGRDIAWAFMVNHWTELVNKFGSPASLRGLVNAITKRFSTEYERKLLIDFKETTADLGSLLTTINSAIERTSTNIEWRANNEDTISQWFLDNTNSVV